MTTHRSTLGIDPGKSAAAVVGVGATPYGSFPAATADSLALDALTEAMTDSGLDPRDIDGLIVSRARSTEAIAAASGIEPRWVAQLPAEGRMTGPAIQVAATAIATGSARTVALVYGNDGRSKGHSYGGGGATAAPAAEGYGTEPNLTTPYGMTSPGAFYAMMLERHMQLYGTTSEQLATISQTFRSHAAHNPAAVFNKAISLSDYLGARFIAEPMRIYDYCLINDGGTALIMTSDDRARDCRQPPVHILGFGQQGRLRDSNFPPDDFWRSALNQVGQDTYAMADCTRTDVDVLMAYDNFSPNVLFTLEGLGYCEAGESGYWIQDGRIALGGELPVNTSGGHLSESYMQGWALNIEAVKQIRHQCGSRQVADATLAQYVCAAPVVSSVLYGATR